MNKIIVACGTGVATSTSVIEQIREYLESNGYQAEFYQCRTSEIASQIQSVNPDVIVSTAEVNLDTDIPVLRGVPFLTGLGVEEVNEEIKSYLQRG
ncbi:PTS sugar transporter subunit IIB [Oceanobacillus sp. FSL W8-0428]|uniref:PTS galactitol transporter subunit IIB n=1 Tax=Oceanobacillus sojae TaxID=582851 RepID=A0A511ZNF2_9BACI|nr:PTS sugar transporter subunit IIB [Oceanobacillus sojae]GEN88981.1 PTS galactitol transporter subunit IIB [Oceanobacillus sojae]